VVAVTSPVTFRGMARGKDELMKGRRHVPSVASIAWVLGGFAIAGALVAPFLIVRAAAASVLIGDAYAGSSGRRVVALLDPLRIRR
jgi:hypothetical protein